MKLGKCAGVEGRKPKARRTKHFLAYAMPATLSIQGGREKAGKSITQKGAVIDNFSIFHCHGGNEQKTLATFHFPLNFHTFLCGSGASQLKLKTHSTTLVESKSPQNIILLLDLDGFSIVLLWLLVWVSVSNDFPNEPKMSLNLFFPVSGSQIYFLHKLRKVRERLEPSCGRGSAIYSFIRLHFSAT